MSKPRGFESLPFRVFYRVLADIVVVVHLAFIVFVAIGGFLAWKWPRVVWLHIPVVVYATLIITVGFTCPLTPFEKYLREKAGQSPYEEGFIDHYLDGVVYPGKYIAHARGFVALLIIGGYVGLVVRRRRRSLNEVRGEPLRQVGDFSVDR